MPTEEYFKANATGIADMSKPGAAAGLIERQRQQDYYDKMGQNSWASVGSTADSSYAAGYRLGNGLAKLVFLTFPIWSVGMVWAFIYGLAIVSLIATGIFPDFDDIPDSYLLVSMIVTAAPVLYYCRTIYAAIKTVLLFAIMVAFYLAIAGVVLGILYSIVMELFGLW